MDVVVDRWSQGAEAAGGGVMITRAGSEGLRVKLRHAQRAEVERAAQVSTLYAQGRVRHVRVLKELEDEMCSFGAEGRGARLQDRIDALVWAGDELLQKRPRPQAHLYRVQAATSAQEAVALAVWARCGGFRRIVTEWPLDVET